MPGKPRLRAVEADAYIGPAECTVFTEICGEFATSKRADRVVGPYKVQRLEYAL